MASPRLHVHAVPAPPQLPLSPSAEVIREHLELRHQELAALEPRALDLAASILAVLHAGIRGRAAELRGTKSPEYRRQQLMGRSALSVEGLCYLALHAPEDVVAALGVLLGRLGYRVEPGAAGQGSLASEGADVATSAGSLSAEVMRVLDDHRVTIAEVEELDRRLSLHKSEIADLEAAIAAIRQGRE